MKVKGILYVCGRNIVHSCTIGTIDRSSLVIDLSRSISVGTRKSCELCQDRGKPGETLVDAHKRSDVQIVAEILV